MRYQLFQKILDNFWLNKEDKKNNLILEFPNNKLLLNKTFRCAQGDKLKQIAMATMQIGEKPFKSLMVTDKNDCPACNII